MPSFLHTALTDPRPRSPSSTDAPISTRPSSRQVPHPRHPSHPAGWSGYLALSGITQVLEARRGPRADRKRHGVPRSLGLHRGWSRAPRHNPFLPPPPPCTSLNDRPSPGPVRSPPFQRQRTGATMGDLRLHRIMRFPPLATSRLPRVRYSASLPSPHSLPPHPPHRQRDTRPNASQAWVRARATEDRVFGAAACRSN
jgi:hypothetical protein